MKLPVKYDTLKPPARRAVREAYIELQEGLCYYCKQKLAYPVTGKIREKKIKLHLYPPGFFEHPVHLHHNHVTGLTLGAVHNYCNAVLWEYHGE